jgi:hypothetical protein
VKWNLFSGSEPEAPVMLYDGWRFEPVENVAKAADAEQPSAPQEPETDQRCP